MGGVVDALYEYMDSYMPRVFDPTWLYADMDLSVEHIPRQTIMSQEGFRILRNPIEIGELTPKHHKPKRLKEQAKHQLSLSGGQELQNGRHPRIFPHIRPVSFQVHSSE
jgi:hypothetical protein